MKKNNKGNLKIIISTIVFFSIVIFIFLFATVGIKQLFSENLIAPVKDAIMPLASNNTGVFINSYETQYNTDWFNYDLFFLMFVIVAFAGTIISSFKTKKMGWFSFFGYITIGSYIFLLILTFVTDIFNWLMTNFYFNLFTLTNINTPIIDFFISNIHLISFIWFLIILMVNQIDLGDFVKKDDEVLIE